MILLFLSSLVLLFQIFKVLQFVTDQSTYLLRQQIYRFTRILLLENMNQRLSILQTIEAIKATTELYRGEYNKLITRPPMFGIAGILVFHKLLNRIFDMVQKQKQFEHRIEAMMLLICNRTVLTNMLQAKKKALEEKKTLLEKPLDFLETHLLQRLDSLFYLIGDTRANTFFVSTLNNLSGKIHVLSELMSALFIEQLNRPNQLIKLQYHMRQFIVKLIDKLGIFTRKWNEGNLATKQKQLIMLDFFICFFQFNAIFISDNSWINFQRKTRITQIDELPANFDILSLSTLQQKIIYLELYKTNKKRQSAFKAN